MPTREELPDGSIRLAAEDVSFLLTRLRPDALVVVIDGYDQGQLGSKPLDEIGATLARGETIELFVDASRVTGVTPRSARNGPAGSSRTRRVSVGFTCSCRAAS